MSLFLVGCGGWNENRNAGPAPLPSPRSEIPFATREPEVYRAEIVIRSGDTERKIIIARNGEHRRIDYDAETDRHRALLTVEKEYAVFFDRRTYREYSSPGGSAENDLVAHILNLRDYTQFEEVDREGPTIRYRARVNDSPASEIMIFFDETVGLPTKQEFYSVDGDRRELKYSVEMRNFTTSVDPARFEIPAGFRLERVERKR